MNNLLSVSMSEYTSDLSLSATTTSTQSQSLPPHSALAETRYAQQLRSSLSSADDPPQHIPKLKKSLKRNLEGRQVHHVDGLVEEMFPTQRLGFDFNNSFLSAQSFEGLLNCERLILSSRLVNEDEAADYLNELTVAVAATIKERLGKRHPTHDSTLKISEPKRYWTSDHHKTPMGHPTTEWKPDVVLVDLFKGRKLKHEAINWRNIYCVAGLTSQPTSSSRMANDLAIGSYLMLLEQADRDYAVSLGINSTGFSLSIVDRLGELRSREISYGDRYGTDLFLRTITYLVFCQGKDIGLDETMCRYEITPEDVSFDYLGITTSAVEEQIENRFLDALTEELLPSIGSDFNISFPQSFHADPPAASQVINADARGTALKTTLRAFIKEAYTNSIASFYGTDPALPNFKPANFSLLWALDPPAASQVINPDACGTALKTTLRAFIKEAYINSIANFYGTNPALPNFKPANFSLLWALPPDSALPLLPISTSTPTACDIRSITCNGNIYMVVKELFRSTGLVGRATRVWLVRGPDGKDTVLKESWIIKSRMQEATFLHGLEIPNGPRLISSDVGSDTVNRSVFSRLNNQERLQKRRIVISPPGQHIGEFTTLPELLFAFLDIVKAIEYLEGMQRVHRDISYSNILLREPEDNVQEAEVVNWHGDAAMNVDLERLRKALKCRRGLVIDFNYAAMFNSELLEADTYSQQRPASIQQVESGVRTVTHTVAHDLESLFYVLLYYAPIPMAEWFVPECTFQSLGKIKWADMNLFEHAIMDHVDPYFEPLKIYLRELRTAVFPFKERPRGDPTAAKQREKDVLQSPITCKVFAEILEKALRDVNIVGKQDSYIRPSSSELGKRNRESSLHSSHPQVLHGRESQDSSRPNKRARSRTPAAGQA
ncbi:hypothetical protein FPV67DRAFT_1475788 [Lyophyllum atratum]|nr:hypothetical protein FPV67DRAFT_1475788 [Lyophyllum atratum]